MFTVQLRRQRVDCKAECSVIHFDSKFKLLLLIYYYSKLLITRRAVAGTTCMFIQCGR